MTVSHVEVLVEEPSAEAALRILLPKILGEVTFEVHCYHCKDNLLKRLPDRLRGYALRRLPEDWRIVVVVDRDDDDCAKLKKRLEAMAAEAGLATKSKPKRACFSVVLCGRRPGGGGRASRARLSERS